MIHRFKTETATRIGLTNAVVLHALCVWIENNETKGQRYLDERYWTYFDRNSIAVSLPFLTRDEVMKSLYWLEQNKYIVTWHTLDDNNEELRTDPDWFDVTAKGYDVMQGAVCKNIPFWGDDKKAYFSSGRIMNADDAREMLYGQSHEE